MPFKKKFNSWKKQLSRASSSASIRSMASSSNAAEDNEDEERQRNHPQSPHLSQEKRDRYYYDSFNNQGMTGDDQPSTSSATNVTQLASMVERVTIDDNEQQNDLMEFSADDLINFSADDLIKFDDSLEHADDYVDDDDDYYEDEEEEEVPPPPPPRADEYMAVDVDDEVTVNLHAPDKHNPPHF